MIIFIAWICFALLVGALGKDRKIGFGSAFILSIVLSPLIGLVIVLFSSKRKPDSELHRYKIHLENAKKYEFKGDNQAAINSYMDALYHLENDYSKINVKKNLEAKRRELIKSLREKVNTLKTSAI